MNRGRYPQGFLFCRVRVLQYIDKIVDVGNGVALWRLVKEFHIFSTCSRCLLGIWTLSPRAPCSGSHLPLCVATVHGSFWTNFVYFLREKWTPSSPRSSHLGNLNISTSSIWQRTKPPVPASVYGAFGRISHIFNVKVDSEVPAQFAPWKSEHYFYLQSYGGGWFFFGGSDAFFALLQVVPELSASFWSPRWRRVLCHRGLLHNETVATC